MPVSQNYQLFTELFTQHLLYKCLPDVVVYLVWALDHGAYVYIGK